MYKPICNVCEKDAVERVQSVRIIRDGVNDYYVSAIAVETGGRERHNYHLCKQHYIELLEEIIKNLSS